MKKIVVLTLCCIWGVLSMSAQSNGLTQKELQFRNGIERILKQKGIKPTIDNEDNSLNWEDADGEKYWLTNGSSLGFRTNMPSNPRFLERIRFFSKSSRSWTLMCTVSIGSTPVARAALTMALRA